MWTLFRFEVKYYFKSKSELINFAYLFLSIVLLKPFVEAVPDASIQHVGSGSLWIALMLAVTLGSTSLFQRDQESGRLDCFQLTQTPLELVIYAKWMAYYLSIILPLLIILPVAGLLMGIPAELWPRTALGLVSGAMPLSIIATLASVLMARLERAGAMLSLMILPMAIPVLIFGGNYAGTPEQDGIINLVFLWGFSLFLLPILGLVGTSCIRSGN